MDTSKTWERIGRSTLLDEVERLLREGVSRDSVDPRSVLPLLWRLQDACLIRSRFVVRLWRLLNTRWEALCSGDSAPAASAVPARAELQQLLQQTAREGPVLSGFNDPVFLDAVETRLRNAGRRPEWEIDRVFGPAILKLWADQRIGFRFIERVWRRISAPSGTPDQEERDVRSGGYIRREELESMLEQAAFEWVEERRRTMLKYDGPAEEQPWTPAVLSFS
jgi:hypothetical protein